MNRVYQVIVKNPGVWWVEPVISVSTPTVYVMKQ